MPPQATESVSLAPRGREGQQLRSSLRSSFVSGGGRRRSCTAVGRGASLPPTPLRGLRARASPDQLGFFVERRLADVVLGACVPVGFFAVPEDVAPVALAPLAFALDPAFGLGEALVLDALFVLFVLFVLLVFVLGEAFEVRVRRLVFLSPMGSTSPTALIASPATSATVSTIRPAVLPTVSAVRPAVLPTAFTTFGGCAMAFWALPLRDPPRSADDRSLASAMPNSVERSSSGAAETIGDYGVRAIFTEGVRKRRKGAGYLTATVAIRWDDADRRPNDLPRRPPSNPTGRSTTRGAT